MDAPGEVRSARGAWPRGSFLATALPTGPTARKSEFCMSHPDTGLIALDAKNGMPVPTFGTDGVVDLRLNDDQEMDLHHR